MIQVLIADDSATLRQLIRSVLESDPELQVVGEARNSKEAVALTYRLQPDIVAIDVHMLQADGYQAVRRIMAESPRPIVVLTGSSSVLEPATSHKALEAGALMVVGKPQGLPGVDPVADEFISQMKAMAEVKVVRRRWWLLEEPPAVLPRERSRRALASGPPRLIAVGASTGGPPALQVVLRGLPPELPVPLVVVQHISRGFVSGLARWLDDTTPLQVKVAEDGGFLLPGIVYMAPDDQHLLVANSGRVRFRDSPPVDGHRPSATVLLQSVAQQYGSAAVGVLLTGMGGDGALGLQALHEAGGRTITQDQATCVVFGMPREAIALGAADEVLPLEQISVRLLEMVTECQKSTAVSGKGRHA